MPLSPLDPFLEPPSTLLGQSFFRRMTLNLADVCTESLSLPVPTSLLLQDVSTCFFGFPIAPFFLLLLTSFCLRLAFPRRTIMQA